MTADNVEWLSGGKHADGTPTEMEKLRRELRSVRMAMEANRNLANRELQFMHGQLEEARAAAMWLRIVLTNMTQSEQMELVYQKWPWLKDEDE